MVQLLRICLQFLQVQNYKIRIMQDNIASNDRIQADPNPNNVNNNNRQGQRAGRRRNAAQSIFRSEITQEQIAYIEQHKILFLSGKVAVVDPKQQSYFTLLRNMFCPFIQLHSLTTILIIINVIVFIVELSLGFDSSKTVLQVNLDTLILMGLNDSSKVYRGEVHRLVVAQFIHINMMHLICNTFILVLLVSRLEYSFGKIKILIAYLIAGIAGDIFSNIFYTDLMLKAGSSTSLYGMIGLSVGYIIINWPAFGRVGFICKFKIIFITVVLVFMLVIFCDVAVQVDYLGHLGAFMCGVFASSILESIDKEKRQKYLRILFGILCVCQIVSCFLVFYLNKNSSYN